MSIIWIVANIFGLFFFTSFLFSHSVQRSCTYLTSSKIRIAVVCWVVIRLQSDHMRTIVIVVELDPRDVATWWQIWLLTVNSIKGFIVILVVKVSLSIHRHVIWAYRRPIHQWTLLDVKPVRVDLRKIRLATIALAGLKRVDVIDDFVFSYDRTEGVAVDVHAFSVSHVRLGTLVHVSYLR